MLLKRLRLLFKCYTFPTNCMVDNNNNNDEKICFVSTKNNNNNNKKHPRSAAIQFPQSIESDGSVARNKRLTKMPDMRYRFVSPKNRSLDCGCICWVGECLCVTSIHFVRSFAIYIYIYMPWCSLLGTPHRTAIHSLLTNHFAQFSPLLFRQAKYSV